MTKALARCAVLAVLVIFGLSKYPPGMIQGWLGGIPMTMEADTNDDVDFVVVRQTATKTKGYQTSKAQAHRVVKAAIELSREILTELKPTPAK